MCVRVHACLCVLCACVHACVRECVVCVCACACMFMCVVCVRACVRACVSVWCVCVHACAPAFHLCVCVCCKCQLPHEASPATHARIQVGMSPVTEVPVTEVPVTEVPASVLAFISFLCDLSRSLWDLQWMKQQVVVAYFC